MTAGHRLIHRRRFLQWLGASGAFLAAPGLLAGCGADEGAQASPSGAPRGSTRKIRIGFIALTDAASAIMAKQLGIFDEYGLDVDVVKQASWANIRDGLLTGELDAAHCLFGMPFAAYTGIGGAAGSEMYVAMMIDMNGQGLTLANSGFQGQVGFKDLAGLKSAIDGLRGRREVTFAMTFPGGTHDMWLRYWLMAAGIDQTMARIITIPPPQMVANMKVGNMDGYSVGEPWNGIGVKERVGFTALSSQDVWKHHPEKALVVSGAFASRRDELKLVMRAMLEASQWLDNLENRRQAAEELGKPGWVNADVEVLADRLVGRYDLGGGLGEHVYQDDYMLFHADGYVNKPRAGHAAWFMTQYVRFGYLPDLPDTKAIADRLILPGLYEEVAAEMGIPVPDDDLEPWVMTLDGARFDPSNPRAYLAAHGRAA
jgi:nitrate/nitrite transport system substrate-binding protein